MVLTLNCYNCGGIFSFLLKICENALYSPHSSLQIWSLNANVAYNGLKVVVDSPLGQPSQVSTYCTKTGVYMTHKNTQCTIN